MYGFAVLICSCALFGAGVISKSRQRHGNNAAFDDDDDDDDGRCILLELVTGIRQIMTCGVTDH